MAINLPEIANTAGIPSQWDDTISATQSGLITGDEPAVLVQDMIVAASQTIPALTPVVKDGNGRLIPATTPGTPCIGITVVAITTDASTTYKGVPVYRAGVFNPDKLNWHAAFDTEAERFAAFEGSASPTQILMRRIKQHDI